jgi:NADH-quinone oxidoreductase subunit E
MPKRSASSSSGAAAAEAAGVESAQRGAPEPAGRSLADKNDGTDTPAGTEPGTSGQGPGKD